MTEFPYRFVVRDGLHAGMTFVYLDSCYVYSYPTERPDRYFRTEAFGPAYRRLTEPRPMTARVYFAFNAIPEKQAS